MTLETKALRYVDIRCEELRNEFGIEYDKFDKHNMYIAYMDGVYEICKEIKEIGDLKSILQHVESFLARKT